MKITITIETDHPRAISPSLVTAEELDRLAKKQPENPKPPADWEGLIDIWEKQNAGRIHL